MTEMTEEAKVARREYQRKYRQKNREDIREYTRAYYVVNKDKRKEALDRYWNKKGEENK